MVVRRDLEDCMKSTDNLEVASAKAVAEISDKIPSNIAHFVHDGNIDALELKNKLYDMLIDDPDHQYERSIGVSGSVSFDGADMVALVGIYFGSDYTDYYYISGSKTIGAESIDDDFGDVNAYINALTITKSKFV